MSEAYTTNVGAPGQIVTGLVSVIIVVLFAFAIEILYAITMNSRNRFQTLLDYTATAEDATVVIHQDARKYTDAKPISVSVNERTGIEFAYSLYMFVNPSTFDGQATFKHVFHKGFNNPWPLMGPGVFLHGEKNSLRVLMNTYANPYTYADINNIPVGKWFHLVLNCYKNGLDIFVNGNLANRIPFKNTIPYQNYQDIILFSNTKINTLRGSVIPSLKNDDFNIDGAFTGHVSNLVYARYALSVNEIQNLMAAGPSKVTKHKSMDKPPYLGDDWWQNSA
jgi:hypothetical protein